MFPPLAAGDRTSRNMNTVESLNRNNAIYEATLSAVLKVPFAELRAAALQTGQCEVADLHAMGRRILADLARLARGEISAIVIPARLPYRGEYSSDAVV